ncbi:ATP-binding protein [Pseudomonas putida]|uniref:ATP-binding protein n=1 Tax=Pseudomonas putida TaxID=303 RepID=UPI0009B6F1EB|nr:ATP-binding protein [Pseudomonas putida]
MIIFVGGMHGVGKTTFCKRLAELTGFVHRTASEVISEESQSAGFGNLKVSSRLNDNQNRLVAWVERNRDSGDILLDGHFALLDSNRQVYGVELEVFRIIRPAGLICINASVGLVLDRLEKRDGVVWPAELVEKMLNSERNLAAATASGLGVPLVILSGDSIPSAVKFVNKLMK